MNSHSVLFSAGRYNNLTEPGYSQIEFRKLSADQVALEYLFENKRTNINLAAYYKFETGDPAGTGRIKGLEVFIERNISRTLKAGISNTILDSDIGANELLYNSENNVGYFLVTTLSYFNPGLFNASVSWSTRQGKYYTPVNYSIYNPEVDFYQPVYSENINSQRFGNYNSINLSINKMIAIHKNSLVIFASIFNLLNTNNPKSMIYNKNYSAGTYDYYQKRSIYFGCMLSFK